MAVPPPLRPRRWSGRVSGVLVRVVAAVVLLTLVAWPERHGVIFELPRSVLRGGGSCDGPEFQVGSLGHQGPPYSPAKYPVVFFACAVEGPAEDAERASRRRTYRVHWTRAQVIGQWGALLPRAEPAQLEWLADLRYWSSGGGVLDQWWYRDAGLDALLNGADDLDDVRELLPW